MPLDDAHDLIPEELAEKIPKLYETERIKDPIAQVKLFTPDSNWTWYIIELDREQKLAWGLVQGFEREFGYISIQELEQVRGPYGLKIERDLHWTPRPVSQCQEGMQRHEKAEELEQGQEHEQKQTVKPKL